MGRVSGRGRGSGSESVGEGKEQGEEGAGSGAAGDSPQDSKGRFGCIEWRREWGLPALEHRGLGSLVRYLCRQRAGHSWVKREVARKKMKRDVAAGVSTAAGASHTGSGSATLGLAMREFPVEEAAEEAALEAGCAMGEDDRARASDRLLLAGALLARPSMRVEAGRGQVSPAQLRLELEAGAGSGAGTHADEDEDGDEGMGGAATVSKGDAQGGDESESHAKSNDPLVALVHSKMAEWRLADKAHSQAAAAQPKLVLKLGTLGTTEPSDRKRG